MSKNSQVSLSFALVLGLILAFGVDSQAKDNELRDDETTVTANKPAVKDEHHPTFRVSEFMGKNIVNSQDESVGEIEDIVLDTNTGNVRYAVVTYGGFLGLGDKMFAVPYQAFQIKHEADDPDECILVLDVTQEQLEGAEGFDEDNWPTFNEEMDRELNTRYRLNDKALKVEDGKVKRNRD